MTRKRIVQASALLLLLVLVMVVVLQPAEPTRPVAPVDGRLSTIAEPVHYRLQLTVLPDQSSFDGDVAISLRLQQRSHQLFLHARDLDVHKVELETADGTRIDGQFQQVSPYGLARVDFDTPVSAGLVTLKLTYQGHYTQTAEGLSRYRIDNDWYVFNQFHPIDARRVFPCFDEPDRKASFELAVISRASDIAISSSLPIDTTLLPQHRKLTRFSPTPRLPTFLLNLSVGPFDVITGNEIAGNEVRRQPLPLRAITTRGKGHQTRAALEHSAKLLEAFERYFAIPYPFDKLDLIAVPDSSASVLENAAAINLRDELMLIDADAIPAVQENLVAHLSHGLAHQWFGNLVTMNWWDNLWLNEAFAEWVGYEIAATTHPDLPLQRTLQQVVEQSVRRDVLSQDQTIRHEIRDDQQVIAAFQSVSFFKTVGLLQMYQSFLGPDKFQQALRNYFARHAFANADEADLFDAFGDTIADPSIPASVDSFLDQPGMPQLEFEQRCQQQALIVSVHQRAYQPAGVRRDVGQWQVPFCLRNLDNDTRSCRLLNSSDVSWSPGWSCHSTVLPNAGGAGYYRWHVTTEQRQLLLQKLPQLPLPEALDFSHNLNASVLAGELAPDDWLAAMPALAAHPDLTVFKSSLPIWQQLVQHWVPATDRPVWQNRLRRLFQQHLPKAQNDPELVAFRVLVLEDRALRADLLSNNAASIDALLQRQPLPTAVDPLALTVALIEQPSLTPKLIALLQQESDASRRQPLLQALIALDTAASLPERQALLLSPALRVHERRPLLQASLSNPAQTVQQWQWLRENFATLLPLLPDYQRSQLAELAESICDAGGWEATHQFLREQQQALAIPDTAIASSHNHVRQCLALRGQFQRYRLEHAP